MKDFDGLYIYFDNCKFRHFLLIKCLTISTVNIINAAI